MVLLTGCVQSGAAPHFNAAAARILDRFGISLVEAPQAGCCGAVPGHLDARDQARTLARRNLDAWTPLLEDGAEAVLVTSSGCGAYLHDYPDLLRDDPAYRDRARRSACMRSLVASIVWALLADNSLRRDACVNQVDRETFFACRREDVANWGRGGRFEVDGWARPRLNQA
jgi:glycolate oxidase iron-sulfur subunit